jgi:hypothetical protein
MGSYRQHGPAGTTGQAENLNDGTLTRASSPRPGPLRPGEPGTVSRPGIAEVTARAASTAAGAAGDAERAIDTLRLRQSSVFLDGSRYRLVKFQDWAELRNDDGYERVRHDAGVGLLTAEGRREGVAPAERSAFEAAARLLADDRASGRDGVLLLLRVLRQRAPRQGNQDAAITPSQMTPGSVAETAPEAEVEEHWVGLELQWDNGLPVDGAAYIVIAPDGRKFTGVTDTQGRALVVGLRSAGQCRISFPEFDRSSLATA